MWIIPATIAASAAASLKTVTRCSGFPAPPGLRDETGNRQLEARPRAVGVDGIHHDLARAQVRGPLRPFNRVHARVLAEPARRYLVAARAPGVVAPHGVHAEHDALRAEGLRAVGDYLRVPHGERVNGNLLGAGEYHALHVGEARYPAADGERYPYRACDRPDHADVDGAPLRRGGDVVEHKLVRPAFGIRNRHVHGIAEVHVVLELDALRNAPCAHVQARYHALRQHESHSLRSSSPRRPDFSGWNWQAHSRPFFTIDVNLTPAYSVTPNVHWHSSA